jgi:hypothetical protein
VKARGLSVAFHGWRVHARKLDVGRILDRQRSKILPTSALFVFLSRCEQRDKKTNVSADYCLFHRSKFVARALVVMPEKAYEIYG